MQQAYLDSIFLASLHTAAGSHSDEVTSMYLLADAGNSGSTAEGC